MNDAEDVCGCLACAALCGVCCVAAAEEDKRERERAAAEATGRLKNPLIQVNPVAVLTPRSQKAASAIPGASSTARGSSSGSGSSRSAAQPSNCRGTTDQFYYHEHAPAARQNARKSASYRSNAYLPPSSR